MARKRRFRRSCWPIWSRCTLVALDHRIRATVWCRGVSTVGSSKQQSSNLRRNESSSVRCSEQLHSRYPSSERFVVNVRYSLVTLAAAVLAFIGAVVLVFASAPHGPSPGYAKAVPLILPFATALAFGCVWFPCLLLASFRRRHRPLGLLVASGILFLPATYWLASHWYQDSQHRAA